MSGRRIKPTVEAVDRGAIETSPLGNSSLKSLRKYLNDADFFSGSHATGVDTRNSTPCNAEGRMRISIITLTIDSPQYFDETISSIERAGPFDLEHIVVHDGDETFIDALTQRYPALKVVKGQAAGATAAAALGVETATGDFILLLHSDDRLCQGALARLSVCAAAQPGVKIWTGGTRIFHTLPDGSEMTVRQMIGRDLTRLSLENICDDIPLLSSRFCHRSVYAEIGNFDPKFSESSDREFLLRAVLSGVVESSLDIMVSEMRLHEGSRTVHRRQGWVPPYFAEHVQIADMWLSRPGVDRRTRRFLRNWRAREMLRLCLYRYRAGEWKAAAGLLIRAESTDPLWIFRLGTVFMTRRRRLRNDDPESSKTTGITFSGVERTE